MDYYLKGSRNYINAEDAQRAFETSKPAVIRAQHDGHLVVTLSREPLQPGQQKWNLTSAEEWQCDHDCALLDALHLSRHHKARAEARAFAGLVRSDVSFKLGDLLLKWVNHGMTKAEMVERLKAAIEQAGR